MADLTAAQLAEVAGVSRQTVYRAHLPKTEGGGYDPADLNIRDWILGRTKMQRAQRGLQGGRDSLGAEDLKKLDRIEQEEKIRNMRERTVNTMLKNAALRKDLIPADVAQLFVGAFSSGIRTNFLQLGTRIARGNTKLRDKIEREIKKAIQKTLDNAAAQLREIAESAIEITDDEDAS
jgi:hypothetical protein